MSLTSWLSQRLRLSSRTRGLASPRVGKRRARPALRTHRPRLEYLEDRLAPATLTVNTLADNTTDTSVLTLRDAVLLVNNGGDPTALGQSSMPGGWSSQIAGSFGSNDTIQFDPSLTASAPQTITLGGSELLLNRSVTITGPGASQLAVSGNNASRVFDIGNNRASVTVAGLTIENGTAASIVNGIPAYGGGGIENTGILTVSSSTLTGNNALGYGGAIENRGSLTIIGSSLTGNSAWFGGGISTYADTDNSYITTTVSGCTVSNNTASEGGGIDNFSNASLTVSNTSFSDNSAYDSGAICNGYKCTMTISNSTLTGNSAGNRGGGIGTRSSLGTVTVNSCALTGNSAGRTGGGIQCYAPLTISGSTLTGNSAGFDGGGIACYAPLTISGSTLTGNSAGNRGGGIAAAYNLIVTDSTVCGNFAGEFGDDIYDTSATVAVTNSDVCVINLASTTTTVTSSNSQSVLGQAVTFTATVSQNAPLPETATGTVTFLLDGSTSYGPITLNSTDQATITLVGLSVGTHTISATYSGDINTAGSTSALFTQTVLSAQQELSLIITQVQAMVTSGALDSGNANALTTKLNNAITSLNSGNTIAGDNQLNALIKQTNAFVKAGKLDSTDAQTLISDIDLAIDATLVSPF